MANKFVRIGNLFKIASLTLLVVLLILVVVGFLIPKTCVQCSKDISKKTSYVISLKNDIKQALIEYQKTIDNYPNTKAASYSKERIQTLAKVYPKLSFLESPR